MKSMNVSYCRGDVHQMVSSLENIKSISMIYHWDTEPDLPQVAGIILVCPCVIYSQLFHTSLHLRIKCSVYSLMMFYKFNKCCCRYSEQESSSAGNRRSS